MLCKLLAHAVLERFQLRVAPPCGQASGLQVFQCFEHGLLRHDVLLAVDLLTELPPEHPPLVLSQLSLKSRMATDPQSKCQRAQGRAEDTSDELAEPNSFLVGCEIHRLLYEVEGGELQVGEEAGQGQGRLRFGLV